jgi:ABC-type ATPase involved in cell division
MVDEQSDEVLRVIQEINDRGTALLIAFEDTQADELAKLLPELHAIRAHQERTLEILEEIRQRRS